MNDRISKIVQKTADVLYSHGLSAFDGEMQQFLISNCALGKLAELYENSELSDFAQSSFLNAWFYGKKADKSYLPVFNSESHCVDCKPCHYLIFIFYGIGMTEGDIKMQNFSESLSHILKKRNPENQVNITHIAAYDDTSDKNFINDGLLADAVQVVLRAYLPYNSAIKRFSATIEKAAKKNPDARLILIGYSGGGVVVSEIDKALKKKDVQPPEKIIRIGSPELKVAEDSLCKTVNIIIPGDPVPIITFMREKDRFNMNNHFLLDIIYDSKNPIDIHSLYFSDLKDEQGVKNYEKTALAAADYIK